MSPQAWKHVVSRIGLRLKIHDGDCLGESGIGAGIFLAALSSGLSNVTLGGADTSTLVNLVRERFKHQCTVPHRLLKLKKHTDYLN